MTRRERVRVGWGTLFFAVRVVSSVALAAGALVFALRGRVIIERLGYAPATGILLGAAELVAAILFAIPKTAILGGVLLIAVLAWAAGFHFANHWEARGLWIWMAVVAALLAAERWRRPPTFAG